MTQPFAPQEHLIKLPRRVKNKVTGAWEVTQDDYLEVKWRLVMFREKYPHGRITTEEIVVDLDRGYARFKATVDDGEGGTATGYGTETKAGFADYCERSETRALGRALAVMGFGTQFVGEELSEDEHVADAPVQRAGEEADPSAAAVNLRPPEPVSGNGHAPEPPQVTGAHPTSEQIEGLFTLALESCHEDPDVLSTRIRQVMNVPANASTSKRLLPKTMSGEQFDRLWTYYQTLLAQLQRQTEVVNAKSKGNDVTNGPLATPEKSASSQSTPPPAGEGPTADPSPDASSSAGSDPADAAERDRVRLRAEVAAWDLRVTPEEVEHVIVHNPYSKARALLWNCRRKAPAATPIEAAAD